MDKYSRAEEKEIIVSEKVFFGFISCFIIALIGVVLNPLLGTYGIIIGAFFTWVMASYLYVIYGTSMLDSLRTKILLFTPTSIYAILVVVLFLNGGKIVDVVSQLLSSISTTIILYLFLQILMEYYKVKGVL